MWLKSLWILIKFLIQLRRPTFSHFFCYLIHIYYTLIYPALIRFILLHFINLANVALKSDIVTFYRCWINTGDIWLQFKKSEKIARWRCGTKISKTNLKTMISPLLTRPQGWRGCQKIRKTKLKTTLMSWSAKIQPKLNKIRKAFRKQGFFDNFVQFWQYFTVSSILAES
jgi:hypothetical protein